MKIIVLTVFILFSFLCFSEEKPIASEQSSDIIAKIRQKYAPVYKKYKGIETKRDFITKIYDPDNGKQTGTEHTIVLKQDYFYSVPTMKTIYYEKDGKKVDPSDYDTREVEPIFPVFDENSEKNYDLRIIGTSVVNGVNCHEIIVTPKKKSPRHFKGRILVAIDTLDIMMQEGSPSDIHWALKEFKIKYYFEHVNGVPALKTGHVEARIYVFIIKPDRRYIYDITATENKPIQ